MSPLFGVMAEFGAPQALLAAVRAARDAGYVALDAHTPMPVEGLGEALQLRTRLSAVTFVAGLLGAAAIFGFMAWAQSIDWSLDIGGRRPFAVTAFIVPTFEITILVAGLATAFAMFHRNRLPTLHHPVFNVPAFARASRDRFFLVIEARDPRFDLAAVRALLATLTPIEVHDVPR